jgi:hypothetical protein
MRSLVSSSNAPKSRDKDRIAAVGNILICSYAHESTRNSDCSSLLPPERIAPYDRLHTCLHSLAHILTAPPRHP